MKKFDLKEILISIGLVILGALLIFFADKVTTAMSIAIGICIIGLAIYNAVGFFRKTKTSLYLFLAIIELAIGIFFVAKSDFLKEGITYLFGFYILIASLAELFEAIKISKATDENMLPSYILAGLGILISIFCFTTKIIVPDMFLKMFGVLIAVFGIVHLISMAMIGSLKVRIEKADNLIETTAREVDDED
jgi:uncharacterized membrane protein HdeD (DUF308 family)